MTEPQPAIIVPIGFCVGDSLPLGIGSGYANAKAAAQSGRWSVVIDCLQSLPIGSATCTLSPAELQALQAEALDLALQVLFHGDFEEQWGIAKIIPKLGEIAIEPLLDSINDSSLDLEDRWFVARILGEFDRPQVIAALVELVKQNEDPELVEIATSALAKIGTTAIATLADLLEPTGEAVVPEHRVLAVTALAQIRHSQTIEPLLSAASDPEDQIRTIAIEALSSFHDPRIPPILLAKLTDAAASVRKAAVVGLCLRSELAAELNLVQSLRPLLFDLNLAVCEATALGLARLPDPRVVEILRQVAIAPNTPETLRSQAILALGWIGTESAIACLGEVLTTAPTDLAKEIIASISKTEHEQVYASQLLIAYLNAENSTHSALIKQEIAAALGNLGNPQVVSDLVTLLGDPDDRVKFYTIAAIAKLSPTVPPQIIELANRLDLTSELQLGVRMCLAHWQI
jgi:HEAT repeat protein